MRVRLCGGWGLRAVACVGLLAALSMLAVVRPAAAGDDKDCLRCHDNVKPMFKKRVVHRPFKEKKCYECHEFHEFEPKLILKRSGADLCISCHTNFPDRLVGHVHPPVAEGLCLDCHDPHSSNEDKLLRETESGSPCFSCHESIQFDLFIEHPHKPFYQKECVSCHNPHASEQPYNLKRRVDILCTGCHDWPKVRAKHLKYFDQPVRCTICHRAHGSANAKLLDPNIHPPVIDDCTNCHEPVRPGEKPVFNVPLAQLCGGCHDVTEGATVQHPPAADGECLTCHEPHRTPNNALLRAKPRKLCAECHDLEPDGSVTSVHRPFADGECARCHNPHGSRHKALGREEVPDLCFNCHRSLAAKLDSAAVVHPPAAEGACTDCHKPHQSAFPTLLVTGMTELCSGCHDAKPDGVSNHKPFAAGVCTSCHDPHAGGPKLLQVDGNAVCVRCHEDKRDLADDPNAHPAAVDACTNCHNPHKSDQPHLLKTDLRTLCAGCHGDVPADYPAHPEIAADQSCLDCHNPHRN